MVSKRKKRRKLKKSIKRILILLPAFLCVMCVIIFGFRIKKVDYISDLGQYDAQEIQTYLKTYGMENSLWIFLKSFIGINTEIAMLDDYSVKLNSPVEITIKGQEKQLASSFIYGDNYFYFDKKGQILKMEPCRYRKGKHVKGQMQERLENSLGLYYFDNITLNSARLYYFLDTKDTEEKEVILNMVNAFVEMEPVLSSGVQKKKNLVKKIELSDKYELTMFLEGGLKVAFGKDHQLNEKMKAFVDIYMGSSKTLAETPGTLRIQWINQDGTYTFIKDEQTKKSKNKKNNQKLKN